MLSNNMESSRSIICIAGLPASGKTTLAKLISEIASYKLVDDIDDKEILINTMASKDDLIITSPWFCIERSRESFTKLLGEYDKYTKITWIFFTNDKEQCLINAKARKNKDVSGLILRLTQEYKLPDNCIQMKTYSPN